MNYINIEQLKKIDVPIDELILHFGLGKTGTTSIQKTFFENKALLKTEGCIYPSSLWAMHDYYTHCIIKSYPTTYIIYARKQNSEEDLQEQGYGMHAKLAEELNSYSHIKTLVFSSEAMSMVTDQDLDRLSQFIKLFPSAKKIRFIFFVRDPLSWNTSKTQQHIRAWARGTKDDYKGYYELFQSSIGKYIDYFGYRMIEVYSFEEAIKHENSIVGFFLELIGFQHPKGIQYCQMNSSISNEAASLLSYINDALPLFNGYELTGNRVPGDTKPIYPLGKVKFELPAELIEDLKINCADDVAWLSSKTGIRYTLSRDIDRKSQFDITSCFLDGFNNVYSDLPPKLLELSLDYFSLPTLNMEPGSQRALKQLKKRINGYLRKRT